MRMLPVSSSKWRLPCSKSQVALLNMQSSLTYKGEAKLSECVFANVKEDKRKTWPMIKCIFDSWVRETLYLQLRVLSLCWVAPVTGRQADQWKHCCEESAGRERSCSSDSLPSCTLPPCYLTAQSHSALCAADSRKPTRDRGTHSQPGHNIAFTLWSLWKMTSCLT